MEGVCQVADVAPRPGCLLLVDVDGVALDAAAAPMEPAELIRIGSELAGILAAVHGRGVLHRGVSPDNVVLFRPQGKPWLIDFDRATIVGERRPDVVPLEEMGGAPAYLAPEQTGRTGRVVDQRADLYALGATLYATKVRSRPTEHYTAEAVAG